MHRERSMRFHEIPCHTRRRVDEIVATVPSPTNQDKTISSFSSGDKNYSSVWLEFLSNNIDKRWEQYVSGTIVSVNNWGKWHAVKIVSLFWITLYIHGFVEKSVGSLYLLGRHSSVTWPDPVISAPLRKGCLRNYASFQCDRRPLKKTLGMHSLTLTLEKNQVEHVQIFICWKLCKILL